MSFVVPPGIAAEVWFEKANRLNIEAYDVLMEVQSRQTRIEILQQEVEQLKNRYDHLIEGIEACKEAAVWYKLRRWETTTEEKIANESRDAPTSAAES